MNMELSIVIPVYACEPCLHELCFRIKKSILPLKLSYEIILVNDGSTDLSWETIVQLARQDTHIKGVRLSKNFGQHHAITAGHDAASGNWIVVMDCDLQDKPEEIPNLYRKAKSGYDIVFTKRTGRKDSISKKLSSFLYNKLFEFLTGIKSDAAVGSFSICSRQVANALRHFTEQNRSYMHSLKWVGFRFTYLSVAHESRYEGVSTYTFVKSVGLAISSIIAYTDRPLILSIQFGFFMAFASLLMGIVLIIRFFVLHIPIIGYTSMMVTITFSAGLTIANLGVLGLYIGKIFNETKHRPLYVIQETVGIPKGYKKELP